MRTLTAAILITAIASSLLPAAVLGSSGTTDYIVRFHDNVSKADRADWLLGLRGTVLHEFGTGDAVLVRLPADKAADVETISKDRRIAHVESDAVGVPDLVPNDPLYASQAHFRDATGQDLDIQAESAWDIVHDASGVTIAVIDDGFLLDHPDLAGRFVPGYDCGNGDADPSPDPDGTYYAHGTGVTGLLAAGGDNAIGVAGVCWDVRVMPLKHHNDNSPWYSSSLATTWAVDLAVAAGVDIIVCSFHYPGVGLDVSPTSQFYRSFRAASDAGIIVVASAGNDGQDLDDPVNARYPASFDFANVVTVAMTGDGGVVMAGASAHGNATVEISAPGVALSSTWIDANRQPDYQPISGTSASAPLVAGAIALIKTARPDLGYPADVLDLLYARAESPAGNDAFVVGGRRLNLYRALAPVDPTAPGPVGQLAVTAATDSSLTVTWTEPGDDGQAGQLDHFLMNYAILNGPRVDVTDPPLPTGPGTNHVVTIGGLPYRSHVDVSVCAIDDYRNRSTALVGCDLPYAMLTLASGEAFFMARTGAGRDSTVVIRNAGTGEGLLTPVAVSGGDWLEFATDPLVVAAGDSVVFGYRCRPSGLCAGIRTGRIRFDGPRPVDFNVTLLVLDAPEAVVTPADLDFGAVAGGAAHEMPLMLANLGCLPLNWSTSLPPGGPLTVIPAVGTLAPGASTTLTVGVVASESVPVELVITTDDPFDGSITVPVRWQAGSPSGVPGGDLAGAPTPLWACYPNPFNPRTSVVYSLPRNGAAGLRIFDLRGALVRTFALGIVGPGAGSVVWDGVDDAGRAVPSGAYFCRLEQGGRDVYPALRLLLLR